MNESRPAPGHVLWRVIYTAHELEGRLEADLAAVGLSMAKAGLLRSLAGAGEPLALSDLAERNQCVRSNITQLVDRLEVDGLVERVLDPGDRRVRRAALTVAGQTAAAEAARITEAMERRVAEALSPADAMDLSEALGRLPS